MNICIINDTSGIINSDSLEKGCGGSETWAILLGNTFVERGNFTVICSLTNEPGTVIYTDKLNIISIVYLEELLRKIHFDFIIVSRIMTENVLNTLHTYHNAYDCVFYQFHDLYPIESNFTSTMHFANKVIALTPYHVNFLHNKTNIDFSKFSIIPNGLNLELFKDIEIPEEKDNRILWCSNPDRGLYVILRYLYDDIKKEIPDFGIDIAYPSYANLNSTNLFKNRDVKILGSLSKKDLYKEMVKHKCWCYPQNFIDTFCICAIEQAYCDVDIASPLWYAPGDIFQEGEQYKRILPLQKEYGNLFFPDRFDTDEETYKEYYEWLKNKVISSIKNYNNEENKRKRAIRKKYIENTYTWNIVANLYENLAKVEKIKHNKI